MFAGAAAAFAVHVTLAVALGSLLTLLPHRLLQAIVGALFLIGAVLLLRGRHGEEDENLAIAKELLKLAAAAKIWPYTPIGTLVTVVGPAS